jgi:hypothetical protein
MIAECDTTNLTGAFVRSTLVGRVCGFVIEHVTIMAGKASIPAVVVSLANGAREIVPIAYVDVIAPAEEGKDA